MPNVSALSAELAPAGLRATIMAVVSAGIPLGLALAGDSTKRPWPALDAVGLYWHFVDAVWVFVLSVVYILPRLS